MSYSIDRGLYAEPGLALKCLPCGQSTLNTHQLGVGPMEADLKAFEAERMSPCQWCGLGRDEDTTALRLVLGKA